MIKLIALVFLFLAGCTHRQVQNRPVASTTLFPNGNYQQDVVVHVLTKGHEKDFDFSALVQKNPESFHLVGYNSFGISLFKIKEENGKITIESSISEINNKKEFFLKVFSLVKTINNVPKDDPRIKNDSLKVEFQSTVTNIHFQNFDSAGVPLKIQIEAADLMQISVVTTKYEFK